MNLTDEDRASIRHMERQIVERSVLTAITDDARRESDRAVASITHDIFWGRSPDGLQVDVARAAAEVIQAADRGYSSETQQAVRRYCVALKQIEDREIRRRADRERERLSSHLLPVEREIMELDRQLRALGVPITPYEPDYVAKLIGNSGGFRSSRVR